MRFKLPNILQVTRCLNEVRSWRPEQFRETAERERAELVSMKSGLGDRNN